ncbi:microcystin degradation protein MlrC [Phyllobacterium myrsinacearum]|uniref:M81 family metallopeptidase n=1 Tax=Phyllobacterium myrsinacearum TaxID=28101 RepID=UPI00102A21EB|nr:M81 family metallopeptidase [Phyllobacterium myrsinacearum]RZS79512.1 microcystin degradation protein MlrC [Phyllobacterium myrsinacearum]
MRVFSAVLATETNTFSPIPTDLAAFVEKGEYYPAGKHPDHMTLCSGPLWALRERGRREGWALFEGVTAFAQPGGRTIRHVYEKLRDELLDDLRAAMPVDMVCLLLHGAMVAEGYDDCEGDILARVRALVGPDTVVGVELDPHCHMTSAMIENVDVLLTFKEYPHTDIYECAVELVDLCARIAKGEIRPTPALADTGMVSLIRTTTEPGLSLTKHVRALEKQDKVLSVSIAQGFPWADVPDMGTRVVVYTDNDPDAARNLARDLAGKLYAMRESFVPPMPDIDEALDLALAAPSGTVVIADVADNAGGGAASDSTFFLRRMVDRRTGNAVIGPVWDPVAVQFAFAAGHGAVLPLRIGGKVGPGSGNPVDAPCRVIGLKRNLMTSSLGGTPYQMGDCALVDCGGVEVLLTTVRAQAIHPDLFTNIGCDLAKKRIVVVKSTQHFRDAFEPIASAVIYAAAEGTVTTDLSTLPYTCIQLPKWPIRTAGSA